MGTITDEDTTALRRMTLWWRPLALCITALLGLAVRLYGLDWDAMVSRSQTMNYLYGPGAGA
ncbi:MAG: hypothetical protein ABI234_03845, partial [Ktedonobacteraceae bacterium]